MILRQTFRVRSIRREEPVLAARMQDDVRQEVLGEPVWIVSLSPGQIALSLDEEPDWAVGDELQMVLQKVSSSNP